MLDLLQIKTTHVQVGHSVVHRAIDRAKEDTNEYICSINHRTAI